MIASSVFVTSIIMLALGFYVVGELKFLAPYRNSFLHRYGATIGWFLLAVFGNLFAVVYAINRKLFLKDTGRSWPTWRSKSARVRAFPRNFPSG